MSETLRDLVVSLSLNTDNFTRNIKSVNKQIQEAESTFKLASAGVENFEKSAAGLQSRLDLLQRKLTLQNDVVGQYQRALSAASDKLTECYTRQTDYAQRLDQAKQKQSALQEAVDQATATYNEYKDSLGETDSATIMAKANMEAAQQEYKDASEDVKRLAGQQDALKKATQNAADAVSTGQKNLNNAQAAVRQTTADIRSCNQELLSDGKSLSVYLGANQPRTQIHDVNANSYQPNWTTTAGKLVITPVIYANQTAIALNNTALTITWKRKEGSGSEAALATGEAISGNVLTVTANKLSSITSGLLTYIAYVTYTDPDTGLAINATADITFALISTGENAKSAWISGEQVFKYTSAGAVSPAQITLTANLQNVTMGKWQYRNSSGASHHVQYRVDAKHHGCYQQLCCVSDQPSAGADVQHPEQL